LLNGWVVKKSLCLWENILRNPLPCLYTHREQTCATSSSHMLDYFA